MAGWGPVGVPGGGGGGGGSLSYPGNTILPDPASTRFNEVTSVPASIWTDVLTYVVPVSPIVHIIRIEFGGNNVATYQLTDGVNVYHKCYTWFNGTLESRWEFENSDGGGLQLVAGLILKVQVFHTRPYLGDFYARLQYREVN